LYALTRRTIRQVDDIRKKLNQKSVGVLPHVTFRRRMDQSKQQLIVLNRWVSSAYKESIRSLRAHVIKAMDTRGTKVLMVTSTLPSEGKSTVALNLALSIAQKGARVALLDADLVNQSIHKLLNLQDLLHTLEHVLRGEAKLESACYEVFIKGFYFIPSGTNHDNSIETLRSPGFLQVLDTLEDKMDYVIIDSPPCGMLSDASALAGISDNLLYVIRQDTANVSQIIDGLQNIGYSGIHILGCVLNNASAGFEGYGYGYGSGYTYGNYGSYGEGKKHGDEALEEHEVS
jgi:succinoglycan biosynthesis transport protein ExoP